MTECIGTRTSLDPSSLTLHVHTPFTGDGEPTSVDIQALLHDNALLTRLFETTEKDEPCFALSIHKGRYRGVTRTSHGWTHSQADGDQFSTVYLAAKDRARRLRAARRASTTTKKRAKVEGVRVETEVVEAVEAAEAAEEVEAVEAVEAAETEEEEEEDLTIVKEVTRAQRDEEGRRNAITVD